MKKGIRRISGLLLAAMLALMGIIALPSLASASATTQHVIFDGKKVTPKKTPPKGQGKQPPRVTAGTSVTPSHQQTSGSKSGGTQGGNKGGNSGSGGNGSGSGGSGGAGGSGGGGGVGIVTHNISGGYKDGISSWGPYQSGSASGSGCDAVDAMGGKLAGSQVERSSQVGDTGDDLVVGKSKITRSRCFYHAAYEDIQATCAISANARISMVAPRTGTIAAKKMVTNFSKSHSYSDCLTSNAAVSVDAFLTNYGKWLSSTSTQTVSVTFRIYKSPDCSSGSCTTKPDETLSIGQVYTSSDSKKYTWWCGGFGPGWSQHDFTVAECGYDNNPKNSLYKCKAGSSPTINGQAITNLKVFRDGKANWINWKSKPSIKANTKGTMTTSTKVDRSGTPWRDSRPVKDNDFVLLDKKSQSILQTKDTTGWMPGIQTKLGAVFYMASDAGDSLRLQTTWKWAGLFVVEMIRVDSAEQDGSLNISKTSGTIESIATCKAAPLTFQAVRAAGS